MFGVSSVGGVTRAGIELLCELRRNRILLSSALSIAVSRGPFISLSQMTGFDSTASWHCQYTALQEVAFGS